MISFNLLQLLLLHLPLVVSKVRLRCCGSIGLTLPPFASISLQLLQNSSPQVLECVNFSWTPDFSCWLQFEDIKSVLIHFFQQHAYRYSISDHSTDSYQPLCFLQIVQFLHMSAQIFIQLSTKIYVRHCFVMCILICVQVRHEKYSI